MPIRSTINKELRLVIGSAWGSVTSAEIKAHQDELLSDPDFNPEFNQFMDGSRVTDWCVSIQEAENAVRRKIFSPSSKRAIVTTVNPVLASIFDAYNKFTKPVSTLELFPDVHSALKWLGIEALPKVSPLRNGLAKIGENQADITQTPEPG